MINIILLVHSSNIPVVRLGCLQSLTNDILKLFHHLSLHHVFLAAICIRKLLCMEQVNGLYLPLEVFGAIVVV